MWVGCFCEGWAHFGHKSHGFAKIWAVQIKILAIIVTTKTKIRHGKWRTGAKITEFGITRAKIERHVMVIEKGPKGLLLIDREQSLICDLWGVLGS